MIEPALENLRGLFEGFLAIPNRKPADLDATPRRFVLHAEGLPEKLGDVKKKISGPKVGAPQAAIAGFARKQGTAESDLQQENGHYVFHTVIPGRKMREVLAEGLPSMIRMMNFPKTMYWTAKDGPRFIRPIRW